MDFKITKFEKYSDSRGELIVFLKASELKKSNLRKFGQIYFVTFNKVGVIRGNHYHKKWREWFGIVSGRLEISLKDIVTGERKKMIFSDQSDQYTRLEIGQGIAHAFKSLSKNATLLNYANDEWSGDDTFIYKLM